MSGKYKILDDLKDSYFAKVPEMTVPLKFWHYSSEALRAKLYLASIYYSSAGTELLILRYALHTLGRKRLKAQFPKGSPQLKPLTTLLAEELPPTVTLLIDEIRKFRNVYLHFENLLLPADFDRYPPNFPEDVKNRLKRSLRPIKRFHAKIYPQVNELISDENKRFLRTRRKLWLSSFRLTPSLTRDGIELHTWGRDASDCLILFTKLYYVFNDETLWVHHPTVSHPARRPHSQ